MTENILYVPHAIEVGTLIKASWWRNFIDHEKQVWQELIQDDPEPWSDYLTQRLAEWNACGTLDRRHIIFKSNHDFMNLVLSWS